MAKTVASIIGISPEVLAKLVVRFAAVDLTLEDVIRALEANPQLVRDIKASLSEPAWTTETLHYLSSTEWHVVATGVHMQRADDSCRDTDCKRVHHYSVFSSRETTLVHLSYDWVNIAPGVQAQMKPDDDGVAVRTLELI